MAKERNIGESVLQLEALNTQSCEKCSEYVEAKREYDEILKTIKEFITTNAPVTKITLSKNTYYDGVSVGPHQDPDMRYLSARSLKNNVIAIPEFIGTFKLTRMLKYILVSEGWEALNEYSEFVIYIRNNKNYYYL